MRLNKYIAQAGICSRRKADELITEGRVTVNNERILEHGVQVDDEDVVSVDGEVIRLEKKMEYYLFRKPKSVITSVTDDRERQTVIEFINSSSRLYPVGRLDFQTSGVLLITNDGEFCNKLSHPSFSIDKIYDVKLNQRLSETQIQRLRDGVEIDAKKTHKCEIENVSDRSDFILRMTIHEGRNRQIRKMIETTGAKVRKLDRISYAGLSYKGLRSGEYRDLTKKEIRDLKELKSTSKNA